MYNLYLLQVLGPNAKSRIASTSKKSHYLFFFMCADFARLELCTDFLLRQHEISPKKYTQSRYFVIFTIRLWFRSAAENPVRLPF